VRIALASCDAFPALDEGDGPLLMAAMAAEGLDAEVHSWDAEGVDWAAFDLVVIRCTWDYWDRREQYLAWTRSVPRLVNSADVVAWNTDKTYLRRLEAAGIPVVPTTWIGAGDAYQLPAEPFVVKPSVSAGARDTAAYAGGDQAAHEHIARVLAKGKTVMLQPYLSDVTTEGETAVLVFGGEVSHAARKSAVLTLGEGEAPLGSWSMSPRTASDAEVELAVRVVEEVATWGDELLYARIDLLPGPVLIELEVTEPTLFLSQAPGSAERFARAVRAWAERSSRAATSPS
jgi:glutathione synthase/RimK-type ligase-like ATP-grasp enzyme